MYDRCCALLLDKAVKGLPSSLLEDVFRFLEEVAEDVFVVMLVLFSFNAGEFLQQVALLSREIGRGDDIY